MTDGDPTVVASLIAPLEDSDPAIAARAAYLLGERAWRRKSAEGLEGPLVAALRLALRDDSSRRSPPAMGRSRVLEVKPPARERRRR